MAFGLRQPQLPPYEVDRKTAALSDDFVAKSPTAGTPVRLLRAEHRREHLDEIEAALKA